MSYEDDKPKLPRCVLCRTPIEDRETAYTYDIGRLCHAHCDHRPRPSPPDWKFMKDCGISEEQDDRPVPPAFDGNLSEGWK